MIGIGTDIIEIGRIKDSLEKHGERFKETIFTENELGLVSGGPNDAQFLAGRWAAKEAIYKSLQAHVEMGIGWKELEILKLDSGAPSVVLHGKAKARFEELGGQKVHISISHCREYAVAYVVVE